jgi:hypothetical protein
MAKVTIEEFTAYMRSGNTEAVNLDRLQSALDAADRAVDQWCARSIFVADDEDTSARVYRPYPGSRTLAIHDCVEIETVVENSVTLTSGTDYVADPLNGLTISGETVPYTHLNRYLQSWWCDGPKATVTVTARWGWTAIPPGVAEATKMLAKDIATSRERTGDVVGFGEFGVVRLRQSPQITGLLSPYRRVEAFGLA